MRIAAVIATVSITTALLLGFLLPLPKIAGLGWTDRNIFFHVPMWFSMYVLMGISFFWSASHLLREEPVSDLKAREAAKAAIFFGLLGLMTGILWSRVTWAEALPDTDFQAWWGWDPKQTFALIAILMYGAYFVLRMSVRSDRLRGRLAATYNIVATVLVLPLTFFLPRYIGGLHPGAEGTPAFRTEDISILHRIVFYISAIGFIALGIWLWQLRYKIARLTDH
ncbi:MAG: cytochrome c biogenesis protein CcsA [Bacteroidia bacterium]|nr:cytochrome c biogenesis protein CcsA [Bacteroidia bacterium]MCX7652021.1 cytochrome c biogenesis protein CcsA [Bacteroidia bacterium]MDW8416308.1 cytochrome c biogenesis protein CcsA [Bacteroidia bacterium]